MGLQDPPLQVCQQIIGGEMLGCANSLPWLWAWARLAGPPALTILSTRVSSPVLPQLIQPFRGRLSYTCTIRASSTVLPGLVQGALFRGAGTTLPRNRNSSPEGQGSLSKGEGTTPLRNRNSSPEGQGSLSRGEESTLQRDREHFPEGQEQLSHFCDLKASSPTSYRRCGWWWAPLSCLLHDG